VLTGIVRGTVTVHGLGRKRKVFSDDRIDTRGEMLYISSKCRSLICHLNRPRSHDLGRGDVLLATNEMRLNTEQLGQHLVGNHSADVSCRQDADDSSHTFQEAPHDVELEVLSQT
jgi:hypothetical protein